MKWTYYLRQKLKIAVALAMVLGIVIITNIADRNYFVSLHNSFASVYEDRLVVEGYIFQLSNILHNRHLKVLNSSASIGDSWIGKMQEETEQVLSDYEKTAFTKREENEFRNFKNKLQELRKLENEFYARPQDTDLLQFVTTKHIELAVSLNVLSEIQIEEGSSQIDRSEKIVASSYFISRIEIVAIIVAGMIVQILVVLSRPVSTRFSQNSRLN
ncbi:MAG TPA: hypothetical protein PKJ63_09010 [Cyclobacteriaceae bacterium]|nr:hypothetical protein [Cyclobacteriaceae bacterium]